MKTTITFFFFSSRRRHTRWTGDWSSDVCSSDLAQQTEVAGIAWNLDTRRTFQQAIECRSGDALEPGVAFAGDPPRTDDVIALFPSLQQLGNELRWILEIRIDDDDRIAERVVEAGGQRQLLAEVSTQIDDGDTRVALTQIEQQRQAAVGAAVVHVHDLDRGLEPIDHGGEPRVKSGDDRLLVVQGDYQRQQRGPGLAGLRVHRHHCELTHDGTLPTACAEEATATTSIMSGSGAANR